ncbi:hypothetical protein ES703_103245 [subsurface metagenome]
MTLIDWLPMPPWLGPPLPRFLGIYWPQPETFLPALPSRRYITDVEEEPGKALVPSATYANEESWEFPNGFDPDTFMPLKIVIHRNATRT